MSKSDELLKDVKFNMDKALSLFEGMINEYHNPTSFIANADSLIQALRNFTWFLQSKKNDINNFDSWYIPWQELMKNNPYMRFIVEMRNSIVKQGINTAKSHALIVLYMDYTQTLLEKKMDIYSTTEEIKQEITRLTKKQPHLKHATGDIQRFYIFNYVKKDDLEVIDTLFYCVFFIQKVYEDFERFLKTGKAKAKQSIIKAPRVDVSDFAITFKVSDGVNLTQTAIKIEPNEEAVEEYKKQYGEINLQHDIKSNDPIEQLRANMELAQRFRSQFDELLPILKYHSVKKDTWGAVFPMLSDRAEKILFWENFSNQVANEEIDKFYLTVDAWTYRDIKKGMEAIRNGEEISSLPNLTETLLAYYLDNNGKILIATSSYSTDYNGNKVFKEVKVKESKPANNAIFTAVFNAWGIKMNNSSSEQKTS